MISLSLMKRNKLSYPSEKNREPTSSDTFKKSFLKFISLRHILRFVSPSFQLAKNVTIQMQGSSVCLNHCVNLIVCK